MCFTFLTQKVKFARVGEQGIMSLQQTVVVVMYNVKVVKLLLTTCCFFSLWVILVSFGRKEIWGLHCALVCYSFRQALNVHGFSMCSCPFRNGYQDYDKSIANRTVQMQYTSPNSVDYDSEQ